jgi:hypothetical protein
VIEHDGLELRTVFLAALKGVAITDTHAIPRKPLQMAGNSPLVQRGCNVLAFAEPECRAYAVKHSTYALLHTDYQSVVSHNAAS